MRRIARDFKEQVGLSPQEMGGRLERIRKVAPEDVDVVLADLRPDVRRLATQAVETAPQTRAEGDVVQAIINRADSPAFAKAREAIESLEGFDDVDDALAALEALENFRRQSRQLAKMLEGATPRSPVEQQIPGGSSSIVAGALNAIKASQNLRRRVGERITRILLGDATEALKELDRLTRFTPGEQLARGARSLFDISSVGGIAAQAGPGTEGLFGR